MEKNLKYKGKKYIFNFSDLCKLGTLMLVCGYIPKKVKKHRYFFCVYESEIGNHIKEIFNALNCEYKIIEQYAYFGNPCEMYELCSGVLINWIKRFSKDPERFFNKTDDNLKKELLKIILSDNWEDDLKIYSERSYIFLPNQTSLITICANLLKSLNYTNLFVNTEYDEKEILDYTFIIKTTN